MLGGFYLYYFEYLKYSKYIPKRIAEPDYFEDLYADSLDLVEIIIECEKEFSYPTTDDKVQNLKTVQDLVNLITDLDNKDYLESTQADLQVDE